MAHYRYKNKVTDELEATREIIRLLGRMIGEGKIDKDSTLDNLGRALKKIDSAIYYVERE
jgi:hypothetical protein